jgi:hypothetical protein
MIEITETTVGTVQGTRIGVGNILDREYRTADGTLRTGPAAVLYILTEDDETKVIAGVGSELTVGGTRWTVVLAEPGPMNRGRIGLEPGPDS